MDKELKEEDQPQSSSPKERSQKPLDNGVAEGQAASKDSVPIVDDPELDAILNDALQDFGKVPTLAKSNAKTGKGLGQLDDMNNVWTEEFIKEATVQFEKKMRECLEIQQRAAAVGGVVGTSSIANPSAFKSANDDINKVVEAATKAAVGNVVEPSAVMSQINEAMKNFNLGPSPAEDFQDGGFNNEELAKMMSNFGMNEGGDEADFDDFLPFMTNFMQKLLSKDLLYPVLVDIVDRYPAWLADNQPKISNEEFDKYNRQYGFMKLICEAYSTESSSDSEETKRKRYDQISELMLKVQCCGSPPKDLIGEDGSFPTMDTASAFANMGMGMPNASGQPSEQCSIV